jgi:hypothetical protein
VSQFALQSQQDENDQPPEADHELLLLTSWEVAVRSRATGQRPEWRHSYAKDEGVGDEFLADPGPYGKIKSQRGHGRRLR